MSDGDVKPGADGSDALQNMDELLETSGFGFRGVNPHIYFTNKERYKDSLKFSSLHCQFFKGDEITHVKFFHPEKDASTSPIYRVSYLPNNIGTLPSNVYVKWLDPLSLEKHERHTIESVEESLRSIQLYSSGARTQLSWTYHPEPLTAKKKETGVIGKEIQRYLQLYNIQHDEHIKTINRLDLPEDQKAELKRQSNAMYSICTEVEKHHHRAMAFLLANAFYSNMHSSEGKAGIVAMFEIAVELIDSTRLTIYCHGGSAKDAHGFSIVELDIAALKEENAIEDAREPPLADSSAASPAPSQEASYATSVANPDSSQSSFTPPSKRRRMASSSTGSEGSSVKQRGLAHSDITIFRVSDSEIIPVLLVEIKSHGSKSLSSTDENQFVRHLLGALQFKDEAYGILINCAVARMYKMYKTVKGGKPAIRYTYKEYYFPTLAENIEAKYKVFDTDTLIDFFRDILVLLTYLLSS